jgi:hypothetical protein
MKQLYWLMRPRRSASVALATLAGVLAFAGATSHTAQAPAVTKASATAAPARASSAPAVRAHVAKRHSSVARKAGAPSTATVQATTTMTTAPIPPATGGMIVAIDPETGLPGMPTPEQVRAVLGDRSQAFRTQDGLVQFQTASGATGLLLDSRFMDFAVVRVGPDGKRTFGCVHSSANLLDLPSGPQPPALEEK